MVNSRLENYNYYRDSRVQASMFSSVWKVVLQEANTAIISFNEDWLIDSILREKIEVVVQKWIDEKENFTQPYRDLKAAADEKSQIHKDAHKTLIETHGSFWSAPREERERVESLKREQVSAHRPADEEYEKLYDRAEREKSLDLIAEEEGFEPFRNRDSEYRFCVRVDTKFEVCDQCRGSGKIVDPNIDCCGLTQEDFDEDPDFYDDYMSGRYDQTCPRCNGKRVESIPKFPDWLNKAIQDRDDSEWEYIHTRCNEMAMGY